MSMVVVRVLLCDRMILIVLLVLRLDWLMVILWFLGVLIIFGMVIRFLKVSVVRLRLCGRLMLVKRCVRFAVGVRCVLLSGLLVVLIGFGVVGAVSLWWA